MAPPPYAPYYMGGFNGGWEQPPMAPYAFHPGWAEPRRPMRERFSYPTRGRLNNGVNRPMQNNQEKISKQVWRAKSPSAAVESGKGKEKVDAGSLILGTETFTL